MFASDELSVEVGARLRLPAADPPHRRGRRRALLGRRLCRQSAADAAGRSPRAPTTFCRAGDAFRVRAPAEDAAEIAKRLERIQFNATLNAELEALQARQDRRATPKLRRLRIGRISAQDEFAGLEAESAVDLGWAFLERLRQSGRAAVESWLAEAEPPARPRPLADAFARLRGAAA